MKKVYLLAGALAAGFAVNAQYNNASVAAKNNRNLPGYANKKGPSVEKAEGDVLYTNTFSTPSDWVFSNAGAAGVPPHTAGDWAIVNAMPAGLTSQIPTYGFPGAMLSNSGGNFALVNSDAAGASATQNAYLTTAAGIDLAALLTTNGSAANAPMYLEFTEIYRHFLEEFYVSISNDGGTTWVEFQVNPEAEVPVNTNSGNPEEEVVNITSVIGGGNWGSDVRIRFRYQGAYDWFWGVDDVKLVEAWDNDVKVTNFYQATDVTTTNGFDYFIINQSQTSFPGATFGAEILNNGTLAQAGVALNANAPSASAYNQTGTAVALPFAATDSISVTVPMMIPAAVGDYPVTLTTQLTGVTDSELTNNTKVMTIRRDQWLYGRDDNNRTGAISQVTSQTDAALSIGNVMDIFDPMDITIISARLINQAAAEGQEIYGQVYLYDVPTDDWVILAETDPHAIVASDLDNFVNMPLIGGAVTVNAGDLLLVVAGHYGGTNEVAFGLAQPCEEQSVIGFTADGQSFALTTPNAVMVRISDQPLSVDENTADFSVNVFPNPAVNEATVSFELTNTSDVTLTVTDLAGKVVYTNNLGNTTAGKHNVEINTAVLAGGIYAVNFSANNSVVTKKLVVKK
ncbi:MAG: T9SS type A sorting domain-containing protein [Fluviicola sp.]|nr:T9SS type A sorting domain-containing protein [Fluviicola sp.]